CARRGKIYYGLDYW
nr:immunoglobulin heavy chain junction region [Mus musculus]